MTRLSTDMKALLPLIDTNVTVYLKDLSYIHGLLFSVDPVTGHVALIEALARGESESESESELCLRKIRILFTQEIDRIAPSQ
uniref:AlNc14C394G11309 protein n=1 Tax=Albugo laibachii Nc14 TaxID=890382 RepID=F0WYP6_9STRA|nr:AlNc14C394G11309 [Albugo laibachii Nc14]|eukprot:CCA26605.1 AlNc14C394G11309 [Albugo laibachii Nc14]